MVGIITGAGQGIGAAIALQLSNTGVSLVVNDLDQELLQKLLKSIQNENSGNIVGIVGDASTFDTIGQLIDAAHSTFGRIDFVIANAGITKFGPFLTFSEQDFDRITDVNLKGSFFLVQRAVNYMISQHIKGSIVLLSSVTGIQAHGNLTAYAMTKAALAMMAKNLVVELSPFGIRINAIAPGAILTERTLDHPDYESEWSALTPLGKSGSVQDVAHLVEFLISNKANHITGQTLVVDGGWTSISPQPRDINTIK